MTGFTEISLLTRQNVINSLCPGRNFFIQLENNSLTQNCQMISSLFAMNLIVYTLVQAINHALPRNVFSWIVALYSI